MPRFELRAMRHRTIWTALVVFIVAAHPAAAAGDTQIGIQGLVLTGHHYETGNNVQGSGGGAFLEITQSWKNVRLHLEGIPVVDTAHADSKRFGPLTQSFGLFNAVASIRLDRGGHLWAGAGSGIVAQRTPQLNFPFVGVNHVNSSRLAGTRFELRGYWQTRSATFFEASLAAIPHMRGPDFFSVTSPGADLVRTRDEDAAMTDVSAAYGIRRGRMEYALGLRLINFSANFVDGEAADRNIGAGPTFEIRYTI